MHAAMNVGGWMSSRTYSYPAFLMRQSENSRPLLMFAAPAHEILSWAGIPQRGRLDGGETVGFQRQENPARIRELAHFFADPRNVVQNPLLCALQSNSALFIASATDNHFGHVEIDMESFDDLPLKQLVARLISHLESRVPSLTNHSIDQGRLTDLLHRASEVHEFAEDDNSGDGELEGGLLVDEDPIEDPPEEQTSDVASVLLTEETQLVDFYQELRIRLDLLERLSPNEDPSELLGFTKEALIGYLQPVVLVDGQHRLRGAVAAARNSVNSTAGREQLRELIDEGADPAEAEQRLLDHSSRHLPVSLLMDATPSEHVFQFVVVNQKATPMGKALLGTIVSTSLSREELEPVAQRLRNAGIRLEDSQAVAYLTRADESPFAGLVQTGVVGDSSGHLQWNVLKGLTAIFRELKGGRLYHQTVDYASKWRRRELANSDLVANGTDADEKYKIWSAPDGPWRDVFVRFFTLVRDRFGDEDLNAHNAWGSTTSNLYNKISLTILAADYFQFLDDRRQTLNSLDEVDSTVEEWLEGVNSTYFARDWRMGSLKKDQGPVQKRWASVWFEYRKDPERLPRVENYRP